MTAYTPTRAAQTTTLPPPVPDDWVPDHRAPVDQRVAGFDRRTVWPGMDGVDTPRVEHARAEITRLR